MDPQSQKVHLLLVFRVKLRSFPFVRQLNLERARRRDGPRLGAQVAPHFLSEVSIQSKKENRRARKQQEAGSVQQTGAYRAAQIHIYRRRGPDVQQLAALELSWPLRGRPRA